MNSSFRGGTGSAKHPDYYHCNKKNCPHRSHSGDPSSTYNGRPHCIGRASGCEHPDHFSPEELEQRVREQASNSAILNDEGVPEDKSPKVKSRHRARFATRTHVRDQPMSATGLQEYGRIDPYAFGRARTWDSGLNQGFFSHDTSGFSHGMPGPLYDMAGFPHNMQSVPMSTMREDAPATTAYAWAQNSQTFPNQGHSDAYVPYKRGCVENLESQNSQPSPNDHRHSQSYHEEEYEPAPRNQSVPRPPNQGFQPPPTQHRDTRQHAKKGQRTRKNRPDSMGQNSQIFEDQASWPPGTQNPYSESRESEGYGLDPRTQDQQPRSKYHEGDEEIRSRRCRPKSSSGGRLQIDEMGPESVCDGPVMRGEVSTVSTRPPR